MNKGDMMNRIVIGANTTCGIVASFLINNLQTIQAIITFCLTTAYLIYKIKEARLDAKLKEQQVKKNEPKRKRH